MKLHYSHRAMDLQRICIQCDYTLFVLLKYNIYIISFISLDLLMLLARLLSFYTAVYVRLNCQFFFVEFT